MSSSFPPPPPKPEQTAPAWWPIGRWGNKQRLVGLVCVVAVVIGLSLLDPPTTNKENPTQDRTDSPERFTDYILRDELCDLSSGLYSGIFVNTGSPRETRTYELAATLKSGGTRVARDSELVIDAPPGVPILVTFDFGSADGDQCVLESVSVR